MDLRSIAFPPLVIAAIVGVLYGFDVFVSFTVERPAAIAHTPAPKHNLAPANAQRKIVATTIPVRKIEAIKAAPIWNSAMAVAQPVQTIPNPPTSSNVANESASGINRTPATHSNPIANDDDEILTTVTNEVEGDDEEPLIAAPPSMATQATPVEMSDDGEIAPSAPEIEG